MEDTFDKIDISTQTIIAKTNWKINTGELFNQLPITDYKVIPKKRGRRPKDEKKPEPQILDNGNIITLKLGDKLRGVDLKNKKKKEELKEDDDEKKENRGEIKSKGKKNESYFRNSLTIVMFCEGKLINFKISKNGKFQFTGCKKDNHAHICLDFIKNYIYDIQKSQNCQKMLSLPLNSNLEVFYITVMANINFSLGFCINKENLDEYVNKNTDYHSLLETTFGYTGVNIKFNIGKLDNIPIIKMVFNSDTNEWENIILNYKEYFQTLDEKEKFKENNKVKFCTFLCFQSGQCIMSSPHKSCMKSAYCEFNKMINGCKSFIEEKIQ
jgi:diadenosine tetraphosphate (Ap4A) HIT family hydrolase